MQRVNESGAGDGLHPLARIQIEARVLSLLQEAQVDAVAITPRHHPNVRAIPRGCFLHRVTGPLEKL